MTVKEMAGELMALTPQMWCHYLFSRDLLAARIADAEKQRMAALAMECGQMAARKLMGIYATRDPFQMASSLGLEVKMNTTPMKGERVVFAYFTPPDMIEIMQEPLDMYAVLMEDPDTASLLPDVDTVRRMLLAHELFHFYEESHPGIYTQRERVKLWSFLGYQHLSPLRALSEIAAMECSRSLCGIRYCPNVLDVLLFCGYSTEYAQRIFSDIMAKGREYGEAHRQ